MTEPNLDITVAYGDESVRMVGDPPFYMLGVSLMGADSVPELERIFASVPGDARKLHWRQLSRRKQRDSLRALAGIERTDIVVVASPLSGRKQERARRKCFEALLPTLEKRGVERLVLESRRPGSDKFDLDYIAFAKGSHLVESIRIEHEYGADQPKLWVADQVLGAMGDYLTRTGEWRYWEDEWKAIAGSVERIDVGL